MKAGNHAMTANGMCMTVDIFLQVLYGKRLRTVPYVFAFVSARDGDNAVWVTGESPTLLTPSRMWALASFRPLHLADKFPSAMNAPLKT